MNGISNDKVYVVYDTINNNFNKIFLLKDDAIVECDIESKKIYNTHRTFAKRMSDVEFDNYFKSMTIILPNVITLCEALELIEDYYKDYFSEQPEEY